MIPSRERKREGEDTDEDSIHTPQNKLVLKSNQIAELS
jgi:hypothetical protein